MFTALKDLKLFKKYIKIRSLAGFLGSILLSQSDLISISLSNQTHPAERFWSHRDFTFAEVKKPPGLPPELSFFLAWPAFSLLRPCSSNRLEAAEAEEEEEEAEAEAEED